VWTIGLDQVLTVEALADVPDGSPNAIEDWLCNDLGGTRLGERRFDIELTSKAKKRIVIDGLEPTIESRDTAPFAAIVQSPDAGAEDVQFLGLDLSEGAEPAAVVVVRNGPTQWTEERYFDGHFLSLVPGEIARLAVISRTGDDTVTWRLRFRYTVRGKAREVVYPRLVDPPLVTSGVRSMRASEWWECGVGGLLDPPYLQRVDRDGLPITLCT